MESALKSPLKISLIVLIGLSMAFANTTLAQGQKRIIQLSGIVLDQDSIIPLPGVHVYVPKAGRGTSTNGSGFFSMPVLVGDSVVISSIGYHRQHTIVPNHQSDFLTLIIELQEDATLLPEIIITPFPTEEVFKQAVLALNIPMDDNRIDKRNLNAELISLMARTAPMDANLNYKYYMDQTIQGYSSQFRPPMNPFLNPFNWARFFKDLKKNKKK
jgi:CarboxypepD_reg-like domain